MTPPLLLMLAIAAVTGTAGAALLHRSRPHGGPRTDSSTYFHRLSGSLLLAFGTILATFATAYAAATR